MKAKKIILTLLIASPLVLTSCSSDNGNGGNTGVPTQGLPGTEIRNPNAFFSGLKQSETLLLINYKFQSAVVGNNLEFTDMTTPYNQGRNAFEQIGLEQGRNVPDVKMSFYDDIFAFAQNLQFLKSSRATLESYDSILYNDYLTKTRVLGEVFIEKRARFYSRRLDNEEQRLHEIGFDYINVITQGLLDINVFGVDRDTIMNTPRPVIRIINNAKKTCSALQTMFNDVNFKSELEGRNINTCDSSPIHLQVVQLPSIDGLSQSSIADLVNQEALNTLTNLNAIADSYLESNAILLNANRDSGINNRIRREWEGQIRRNNSQVRQRRLERAIVNNLYENLVFKRKIMRALLKLNPLFIDINNSRRAIRRALDGLTPTDINFKVGSSAISNGIDLPQNNPGINSGTRPQVRPDFEEDVVDEAPIPLNDVDEEPEVRSPAPAVIPEVEEDDDGPPPPPTTIRRRP